MTCMIQLKNDNDDVNRDDEEKFGDLSRPLADQFTHLSCSLDTTRVLHCSLVLVGPLQSRVWDKDGAGEIYCPDISRYNSCPAGASTPPYNTSTLSALQ